MSSTPAHVVTIKLGKTKLVLLLCAALAFVVAGCLLVLHGGIEGRIVGVLSVAFFGACAGFIARKVFDRRPGLVIDEDGFTDNSGAVAAGRVSWSEVRGVEERVVQGQRFLVVQVAEPGKFLARRGAFARWLGRQNLAMVGSPVNISANSLQIEFDTLKHLFTDFHERSRSS